MRSGKCYSGERFGLDKFLRWVQRLWLWWSSVGRPEQRFGSRARSHCLDGCAHMAECRFHLIWTGRRIVAVGTTVVRALETVARTDGQIRSYRGETDIFITPGFPFKVVDTLLTNFHLPRTTLLMLVSALTGTEFLRQAYAEAIRERYRFYSYGDAMLVL